MTVFYAKNYEFFKILSTEGLFFYFDIWESYKYDMLFTTIFQFERHELSYDSLKLKGYT